MLRVTPGFSLSANTFTSNTTSVMLSEVTLLALLGFSGYRDIGNLMLSFRMEVPIFFSLVPLFRK